MLRDLEELAKMADVKSKPKKVPCKANIQDVDNSAELDKVETHGVQVLRGKALRR